MKKVNYNHWADGFRFFKFKNIYCPLLSSFSGKYILWERPSSCGRKFRFPPKTAELGCSPLQQGSLQPLPLHLLPARTPPTTPCPWFLGLIWPAPLFSAELRLRSVWSVGSSCGAGAGQGRAGRGWVGFPLATGRLGDAALGEGGDSVALDFGTRGAPRRLGLPDSPEGLPPPSPRRYWMEPDGKGTSERSWGSSCRIPA